MIKTRFEWDPNKDLENQKKHGIPLVEAQYAFADPRRVIAEDTTGSETQLWHFDRPVHVSGRGNA